ncbi:MAG TPA: hypothetical protein VG735_05500, partial [Caulobacterales bacterium]|nr:hypothetical protein [Caulobacterales bacterium]
MPTDFEKLEAELPVLKTASLSADAHGFFVQEVLRFCSIAGTLLNSATGFKLDASASVDERYITHILTRSLLENYFTVLYLFDDPAQTPARWDEVKYQFKEQYRKLMNSLNAPAWATFMQAYQGQLQPAPWPKVSSGLLPNVDTMLGKLRSNYGTSVSHLYP